MRMSTRFKNTTIISRLILIALIFLVTICGAQGNITSIKKGNEDGRSWAVLYCDAPIHWSGVAQSNDNLLSLYIDGGIDYRNSSLIQIDEKYQRSISLTQLRSNPPVSKIDIRYEKDIPILILKKQDVLIITLNGSSFLDSKRKLDLTNQNDRTEIWAVQSSPEQDKEHIEIQYSGKLDIAGFYRQTRNRPKFIFGNTIDDQTIGDFWYDLSAIQYLSIEMLDQEFNAPTLNMTFKDVYTYSIADKKEKLIIEAVPLSPERQLAINESNIDKILPDSSNELKENSQDLSPSGIVDLALTGSEMDTFDTQLLNEQKNTGSLDQVENVFDKAQIPDNAQILPISSEKSSVVKSNEYESKDIKPEEDSSGIPWNTIVSFSFKDTPIKDALRAVAISNDLNMVIADGISGNVTMNLKDITLRQAIDKIIHLHNAEYVIDGNILTIKPVTVAYKGGRITRIYRLRYADAENIRNVIKNIASNDSLVEVFHPEFLNYDEAGKNRKEAGKVAVQGIRRASILVVTDQPEKIKEIDYVIRELDKAPRQILIKSKLVEMSPEYTKELGIDWEQSLGILGQGSSGSTGKESTFQINTPSNNFAFQKTMTVGQVNQFQYSAMLDFIQNKTDAKLISNPSLLAADNEEASISVGTTVPIAEIQRGLGGSGDMITFNYKEVNIQLNVSPHIGGNDEIVMFINPIIEEITGWIEYGQQKAPITSKRAVNSIVKVQDGATLVIGGLIKNQRRKITKKLFILGELPLVGSLFQHEEYSDTQTNLLIFITPTIVDQI